MSILGELFSQEPIPFLENAWEKAGFEAATAIQERAVPLVESGKDLIAEAPTGTGKTLAYILPIMQNLDMDKVHVQAVIIASSHELVMQIHEQIQTWGEGSGIKSASLIGGANIKRQMEKLKKHPQIVVGTPGRIEELIQKKKLKMHEVNTIVLDEADQLLVPGHEATIETIIERANKDRQLLVFSATVSRAMEQVALYYMNKPEIVRINEAESSKPTVHHYYIVTEQRDKIETVRKLANLSGMKGLVFGRDIGTISVMAEKLAYKGVRVAVLHSDIKKQDREKAMKAIRNGDVVIVLATDVAARGLDIKDLTHVIQLDVPKEASQYVHRAGRTGRLGSKTTGAIVSLVTASEEEKLKKIARKLEVELEKRVVFKGQLRKT